MAKKLRYSGQIPRVPIDADTSKADRKIDKLFDRVKGLKHIDIDADISMAQRRLEAVVKRNNSQISNALMDTMLKDFKVVLGAMKTEFESLGDTSDIYRSLEKTCDMVEERFANLTISVDKKKISGLEDILNTVTELQSISDFSFGEIVSSDTVKNSDAVLGNVKEAKKEIASIVSKVDYIQKTLNKKNDQAFSTKKLQEYQNRLHELRGSLKSFYSIDDEIIQNALLNATTKINAALSQVDIQMPKAQGAADPLSTGETIKGLATVEKKTKAIEEVAKRISKNSSINGLKDLEHEAVNVTKALSEMYDEGIRDTERYITLQYKLDKIFDKMGKRYGGVRKSGAGDTAGLRDLIFDTIQQVTGVNLVESYGSVMESLLGNSDFSLFNKSLSKLGMKDIAELLLVTGKTGDWVDMQKQVTAQEGIVVAIEDTTKAREKEAAATEKAIEAKKKYYEIDEKAARIAKQMRSHDDYKEGSATASYRAAIDEIDKIVEEKKKQFPDKIEKLDQWRDRYAKNLAQYINRDNQIGAQYPSVMISGAGNYNINKHNKQMASWGKNFQFYEEKVVALENKIKNLGSSGTDVIRGDEADSLERLEAKVEYMKYWHEVMVEANKYYRKHKSLEGFTGAEADELERIKQDLAVIKQVGMYDTPYPSYALTNDGQNIKRLEGRITELKRLKENTGLFEENDIYKLWEGKDSKGKMRIRIEFTMDRVDNEIYNLLRKNAFNKTKEGIYQRQLTENARSATKRIQSKLHEFYGISDTLAVQPTTNDIEAKTDALLEQKDAAKQLAATLKLIPKKEGNYTVPETYTALDGKYEVSKGKDGWNVYQRDSIGMYNLIATYKQLQDVREDASLLTREEIIVTEEAAKAVEEFRAAYQELPENVRKVDVVCQEYVRLMSDVKNETLSAANALEQLKKFAESKGLIAAPVDVTPQPEQLKTIVQLVDNYGHELDDVNNKLMQGVKLLNEQSQVLRLFHNSPEIFDAFDLSKAGTNQGQALGLGNYLALSQRGEFNTLDYGRYQTQWYANVQNPFKAGDRLSSDQAAAIIDKFISDSTESFKQRILTQLLDGDVITAVKDIAEESKTVVGEVFGHLGYDAIMDGAQINVFDPSKIFRANDSVLDIGAADFSSLQELQKQIWDERRVIEEANRQIKDLSNEYSGKTVEELDSALFTETLIKGWGWQKNIAKIASAYKELTGELPKVDGSSEESIRQLVENYEFTKQSIQEYQAVVTEHEAILNKLVPQFEAQKAITDGITQSYLAGNISGVVNPTIQTPVAELDTTPADTLLARERQVELIQQATDQTLEQVDAERQLAQAAQETAKFTEEELNAILKGSKLDGLLQDLNIAGEEANELKQRFTDIIAITSEDPDAARSMINEMIEDITRLGSRTIEVQKIYDQFRRHMGGDKNKGVLPKKLFYDDSIKVEYGRAGLPEWSEFRRSHQKYLSASKTSKTGSVINLAEMGSFASQLADEFGELFSPEFLDKTVADQFIEIMQVWDAARAEFNEASQKLIALSESDKSYVSQQLTNAFAKGYEGLQAYQDQMANGQQQFIAGVNEGTKALKNQGDEAEETAEKVSIIQKTVDEALAQLRDAKNNKNNMIDLTNVQSPEDLKTQIGNLVQGALGSDLTVGSVDIAGNLAGITLFNKELGVTTKQVWQLGEAIEETNQIPLEFVSADRLRVDFEQARKYIAAQEKAITDAEKWLLGATKRLDSQKRAYQDSQKKIDGSIGLLNVDATTLEQDADKTIDGLAAHIQKRISENMGKSISDGLKNQITQDLNALENEIKIQQLQQYTSTTMSASEAEAARQVILDTIDTIAANAKKKNVFDQIQESYESLRARLTDNTLANYIDTNFTEAINEMRVLRADTSKASAEEGNLKNLLSLQEQLYNAKKKVAELDAKGQLETSSGMAASRKAQELEDQYNASVKLLENERQRAAVTERQARLEAELGKFKSEQTDKQQQTESANYTESVKGQYQTILDLVNKINTANERMIKFQQMDGGSGLAAKQIGEEQTKRLEAIEKLNSAMANLNIGDVLGGDKYTLPGDVKSIGTDYSQIAAFINDAGVQAELTTAEIEKLVNALVKAGDIDLSMLSEVLGNESIKQRAKQISYEQQYFSDKTMATVGSDGSTTLKAEEIQKLGTAGNTAKEKLEGLAQSIAKNSEGAIAMTKNFSMGADGIARLDFSIFDTNTGSIKNFTAALGTATGQMGVFETTVDKLAQSKQKALSQIEKSQNSLASFGFGNIGLQDANAPAQVTAVLEKINELRTALESGDDTLITKCIKDLADATKGFEKAGNQAQKMKSLIEGGQAMDQGMIDPNGNIYNQLIGKAQQYAAIQGNATLEVGKFDKATNTLSASLVHANGTVEQVKFSMYGLGGECASQQVGVTKLTTSWDRFKTTIMGAGKHLMTALVGYNVFFKAVSEVRKGIGYVKDIDLALTELKKVTDETEASYSRFLDTAASSAGKIGSTVSDFTEATANFARLNI